MSQFKRFDFETAAFTAREKSRLLKQPQSALITELEEGKVRLFRVKLPRGEGERKGRNEITTTNSCAPSHTWGHRSKETDDLSYQSC